MKVNLVMVLAQKARIHGVGFLDIFQKRPVGVCEIPRWWNLTPRLHRGCDRILGFVRNDRGHSASVSKTVSVRSPLSQK